MEKTSTLVLTYKGNDGWDRPVYEHNGRLYVDVNPRKCRRPEICTKNGNEFHGEPDSPIPAGIEFSFEPHRITW